MFYSSVLHSGGGASERRFWRGRGGVESFSIEGANWSRENLRISKHHSCSLPTLQQRDAMAGRLGRQVLIVCVVAALVATVGSFSFHTPTRNLNANNNNVRTASRSRSSSSTPPTSPQQQRGLRDHLASRRGIVSELSAGAGGSGEKELYTPADLEAYSKPWGITLHYRSTLNTYRIEAHRPNGEVAGYTTGFYLGDLLHLDKVQVRALSNVLRLPLLVSCTAAACVRYNLV